MASRAVIFELEPTNAEVDIRGLSFNIGGNYLLLEGTYKVTLSAPGYFASDQSITVTDQPTQTFDFKLEPLPGALNIISELEAINVTIDNDRSASAPGLIEGLSRGSMIWYLVNMILPIVTTGRVVGLGKTQDINVSLKPAWGQMRFDSKPQQANLFVDDKLVGKTPITTEILQTGSTIRMELAGYKSYQEEVTVIAGSSDKHPQVTLKVADGTLQINSKPSAANVTLNKQFIGTTPLTQDLAPNRQYHIELFKEGYLKSSRKLSLLPQKTQQLDIVLKPNIGSIDLNLQPSDAKILVNGQSQGKGNRTLSLSVHKITISKQGYQSKTITVRLDLINCNHCLCQLLTLEEAYWATRPETITCRQALH